MLFTCGDQDQTRTRTTAYLGYRKQRTEALILLSFPLTDDMHNKMPLSILLPEYSERCAPFFIAASFALVSIITETIRLQ